ncbi:MAG: hypothetical protein LBJ59_11895 [Zoogloeaceae bacterium]|jgi:hypothetical protein|nr:hypothetical protein [Zoogloeaceae bacterium]
MLRFNRRSRRLLLLESGGARLYVRLSRAPESVREVARFTPDSAGRQALSVALEKTPEEPVALLVNLPEEGHVRENIPRLRGGERSAMIKRRLRQHFGDNPFVMAVAQGEVVGQRREERLLLTALPCAPLQAWLAALRQTPIIGIYGAPQMMAEWLQREARLPSAALLLSLHPHALRQTLMQNGRVLFSRLSPAPEGEEKNLWIAEETARLYAYLAHQQYVESGVSLPVCLLAATPDAELAAAFAHSGMTPLTLQPLAWKKPPTVEASGVDALLLACLAARPLRQDYAPAALRQQYLLPKRRRLLLGAGVLFLLTGVCSGGMDMLAARDLRARNNTTHLEVARLEAEAQALLRTKPELSAFPRIDINDAHKMLDEYARYPAGRSPEIMLEALQQLADALDRHPGVHLEKLRWQAAEKTLNLQGYATGADFARFLRHLARMNMNYENRQTPEDAPIPSPEATGAAFDLALHLESAS